MAPTTRLLFPLTGLALLLALCSAQAQQIYRHVGPDGKVSYSDQPPTTASAPAAPAKSGNSAASAAPSGAALPYELRQIANRYPVILYTSNDCAPCASARTLLTQRGVPFSERTITTREDSEALQRISGTTSLPFSTIGGQQLKGFSDLEWSQYLDAAGYPKTSQIPSGYRNAAPAPLVAIKAPTAAAPAPEQPAAPERASQPDANIAPRTSGGIQF